MEPGTLQLEDGEVAKHRRRSVHSVPSLGIQKTQVLVPSAPYP